MTANRPHSLPRIVATDLDGTLLRSDGTVSARTRRALRSAEAAGAEVVFVTARPPRYVDSMAEAAGHEGIAICCNGAIVYDVPGRLFLDSRLLPTAVARKAAEVLVAVLPGSTIALETGRRLVSERDFGKKDFQEVIVDTAAELWETDESIVKLLVHSTGHHADLMMTAAHDAALTGVEVTHSGGSGMLEISSPGVTKAGTLALWCAARGIGASEVVAFGDMPNDLSTLTWAGTGYAMSNAHPDVLAAAPLRAAANDDDGVARVLEEIYGL
ncbi:HAD-IIB family hydrolase [Streptomyces sp. H10-C2]|uniref:HAD-IIB family hydrolase n=1 Tax=unclassified Streptomyces TaxID=2593676 RepID=UPI0024BB1746|nr:MULTISPECIES: HAD-IIB family hydrolase [unclassified Streptomyces]MDJ0344622.1 HAD-IIB family hydrolase [Streptomyces sp. PH10-H1]MDJ0373218.1 HAD-IIB family hydrolase [Streptomyces sp. H10-C2]